MGIHGDRDAEQGRWSFVVVVCRGGGPVTRSSDLRPRMQHGSDRQSYKIPDGQPVVQELRRWTWLRILHMGTFLLLFSIVGIRNLFTLGLIYMNCLHFLFSW